MFQLFICCAQKSMTFTAAVFVNLEISNSTLKATVCTYGIMRHTVTFLQQYIQVILEEPNHHSLCSTAAFLHGHTGVSLFGLSHSVISTTHQGLFYHLFCLPDFHSEIFVF